ncbi:MAG: energy-coupling factor ABC transporter ATP-binding protein [Lachnospiraceae bacterium]|nr:energy-coupling factor ABC transporter ATP-binding protein [Lachnospiraceae bacterium]
MNIFTVLNVNFQNILKYSNIKIEENKTTFISGKSGTGKSTLLKILNASVPVDSGEIFYNGKPIDKHNTIMLRKEVMLASQNVFLFDDTIENNFLEYYRYRETTPPDIKKMQEYLNICAANFSLDAMCSQLSGGERQRVFIAICLSFMPRVLMLDEPTSALDGQTANELIKNLKSYCKENKITLISICHDKNLVEQYADEVINLN